MNDIDAGAPRERTVLAWQRTGLSVLVAALVLLRLVAGSDGGHPVALAGVVLAALLSILTMVESRRWVGLRGAHRGGRAALLLTASVILLLLTELEVVLVGS